MNAKTVAVTVTYGRRFKFLEKTLRAVGESAIVNHIVLVINDSAENAVDYPQYAGEKPFTTLIVGENKGSAAGFSAGLEFAMTLGSDFIFLFDDDNLVLENCIENLARRFERCVEFGATKENLAVLAYRPDHLPSLKRKEGASFERSRNGYLGFELVDIPRKIVKRLYRGFGLLEKELLTGGSDEVNVAPYSGLFLSKELVKKIGFPMKDLVLYADDTEFSYRITAGGGKIVVCAEARIEDLERSWNLDGTFKSSIEAWLKGKSDFRAYYSARNSIWFEKNILETSVRTRRLNASCYLLLLKLFSVFWGRSARYKLLRRAAFDGERGNLGISPDFPLV